MHTLPGQIKKADTCSLLYGAINGDRCPLLSSTNGLLPSYWGHLIHACLLLYGTT